MGFTAGNIMLVKPLIKTDRFRIKLNIFGFNVMAADVLNININKQ
jgi:hypothetical protein